MDRRTFVRGAVLVALSAPAVANPLPVNRKRPAPRVGVLGDTNPTGWTLNPFPVELECRWTEGVADRLDDLAGDLVRRDVDVVVALGTDCARAVRSASATVPLVVVADDVPVDWSGGNVTALVVPSEIELARLRLALLRHAVPGLGRTAVFTNPDSGGNARAVDGLRGAAAHQGMDIDAFPVRKSEDIEPAFATIAGRAIRGLLILPDPLFAIDARAIVELAATHRVAALYSGPLFVDAGGLMALYGDLAGVVQRTATLVARILAGECPQTLGVERFDALHLAVNRRTASTFGIAIAGSRPANDPAIVRVSSCSWDRVLAKVMRRDRQAIRVVRG